MFRFQKEQTIIELGAVKVGGQPGELPTVLAGTIFYAGHRIVTDPAKGEFDRPKAEALIKKQEELTDATGLPHMLQVVAETPEAMRRYIDFTSGVSKSPFLIDSTEVNTRIQGTQYVQEVGLADRAIYNSINVSVTEQELAALKKARLPCIILVFNPKQQASLKGRLDVLISGGGVTQKGLLDMARECTDKILIDVAVTAFGIGAGPSEMSTYVMKTKLGLPIGCGIHNAVSSWVWLKNYKKQVPEGKDIFRICDVSSAVVHVMCGGDFVLYGPIENAPYVFPPVAMADCFIAEAVKSEVGTTPSKNHPLNKLIAE